MSIKYKRQPAEVEGFIPPTKREDTPVLFQVQIKPGVPPGFRNPSKPPPQIEAPKPKIDE